MKMNEQRTDADVQIIRKAEELEKIRPLWHRLAVGHGSPLLDFDWFYAAAGSCCPPGKLFVAVYRGLDGEVAIAPLFEPNGHGELEILGTDLLSEPSGFLYSRPSALVKLLPVLQQHGKSLFLKRIPVHSTEHRIFCDWNLKQFLVTGEFENRAPYLPLAGSWEEFIARLSSRRRSDLRRARRRAEAMGRVKVRVWRPKLSDLSYHLERFYAVEAANWKGRNGTAILQRPRLRRFFDHYAELAASRGILRFGKLTIDGKMASGLLGVVYANRFFLLKIGYDEAFRKASPGILLIHEAIRYAFSEGLDSFEFLGYDEPWLSLWKPQYRAYLFLRAWPLGPSGAWRFVLNIIRKTRIRLRKELFR